MAPSNEEIAAQIRLSPAEKQVLMEQANSLSVAVKSFHDGAAEGDGLRMHRAWMEMSEAMSYIGSIVSIKGNVVVRHLVEREEQ